MAKLGYTFYPKDWRSSMNVSQLNLQEKGFYRELIDECFIQNSCKIKINYKTFTRINQLNVRSFTRLLAKLHESLLIVCPNFAETLTEVEILIPSVSHRLGIIDSSSIGGKSSSREGVKNVAKEKENIKENIKKKEKVFVPPTILEFNNYFIENGFSLDLSNRAFKSYDVAGWVDSKGNKILNWKQKCQHVWFKNENKDKSKERGMIW